MSCAYGKIIFGWPWDPDLELSLRELTEEERKTAGIYGEVYEDPSEEFSDDDAEALGFETFYNASDSGVSGYLGVKLDNVNVYSPTLMSEFNTTPTSEQEKLVYEKRAQLPQKIAEQLGKPRVWIVWGDT